MIPKEPVLTNGTVAVVAAVLTPVLLHAGLDADAAGQVVGLLAAIATAVVSVWQLFRARSKVTPVK